MSLDAGSIIGDYVVEALVGEGAFATVYRVRNTRSGRIEALKVLQDRTPRVRQRLMTEGRLQSGLRHENLVAIRGLIDANGAPGLIMEYVRGPNLQHWLERTQPTLAQAEALFSGIVAGVTAAHAHGVVHRDLKPENVLIEETEGGLVPKVTDFGYAKIVHGTELRGLTHTGTALGTPAYMAPEQIRDAKRVDARADIFSLGCVLYRLVCGVVPFDGPDSLAVFNKVVAGSYVPPRELVPDLPPRIERAIEGALRLDPERRIQDGRTLLQVMSGRRRRVDRGIPMPAILVRKLPGTRIRVWHAGLGLAAVALVAGLGGVAIALLTSGAQPAAPIGLEGTTPAVDPPPCAGPRGEIVGFARVETAGRLVGFWTPPTEVLVHSSHPGESGTPGPIVCALVPDRPVPIRVMEVPGGARWVAILGTGP